jgi:hypothetical protein
MPNFAGRTSVLPIFICLLLVGCSDQPAMSATQPPTATTVRVVQASPLPTLSTGGRVVQAIDTPAPTPDIAPTAAGCGESVIPLHTVEADIDYRAHTVEVVQQTRYINLTGIALNAVVMQVEPNRYPGIFTLHDVSAPALAAYDLTGRRLTLELTAPLEPGCPLEVEIAFRLNVTPIGEVLSVYSGYLGYSQRQFNLGLWLPMMAVFRGGAWVTHDPALVGEQIVSETADWDVTLRIADMPDGLIVAAPGTIAREGNRWHIRHEDARDFTVSMSPDYNITSAQTEGGVTIEAYTFNDALVNNQNVPVDGAAHLLEVAAQSLGMYADLFGAYPYDRFLVIQADFRDGMEFSDLVFVGGEWFRTFPGSPASYLTIITVHEVAHQWWYARVGSDQAIIPWLDEALATYSEYIYYEEFHPDLKDWWWTFRVDTFLPRDYDDKPVSSTVYVFSSAREYINAVYLRGARMLHELREAVGTEAFFAWLRRYADAGAGQVVDADIFWTLMPAEHAASVESIRRRYGV